MYPPEEEMNDLYACIAQKDGIVIDMAAVRIDVDGTLTWIDEKTPIKTYKTFEKYYEQKEFERSKVWVVKKQILLESKKKNPREKDLGDVKAMEQS